MRYRLALVGPMTGRIVGQVTTQGETLSSLFAREGHSVMSVSSCRSRYARVAHIVLTLLAKRHAVDVVILQVFSGPSFVVSDLASRLARGGRRRLVMALHGGNLPLFMKTHPRWARAVIGRADALVAPSAYLARAVEQLGYRCELIPNVIDLRAYNYRPRERVAPRLFWMRSFHWIYNPELAVRVFARVRSEHPDATLVMAGSAKGLEARSRRLAADLGVFESVRFAGFLDVAGKVREMGRADVFLNTNRIDNMPVSVLEACATGLPVVATAVGGIADLLSDGQSGLLVPDDDDEAMSSAVLRLIRHPELAARISAGGRAVAESCSVEQVLPMWQRLLDAVMNPASRGSCCRSMRLNNRPRVPR